MKWLKLVAGLLLLPFCVALARVLWDLLLAAQTHPDAMLPMPALALLAGLLCWVLIFTFFPQPVRSYIIAHEFTHVLWGILMGASIHRIRIRHDHGDVQLSKTNFLITLAPYFFPFYTVLLIVVYGGLQLFFDVSRYDKAWLFGIGATWGFHLTFTISALLQKQSDIRSQGHLFSYTFITLANLTGICLWVIAVTDVSFDYAIERGLQHGVSAWTFYTNQCLEILELLRSSLARLRH